MQVIIQSLRSREVRQKWQLKSKNTSMHKALRNSRKLFLRQAASGGQKRILRKSREFLIRKSAMPMVKGIM